VNKHIADRSFRIQGPAAVPSIQWLPCLVLLMQDLTLLHREEDRKKEKEEEKKIKKKENLIVIVITSRNNNNNNQKRNGDVVCEEQVLLDISEGGDGSLDILEMGGSKLDHRLLARLTQEAKALQGLTSCHHLHKK